MPEVYTAHSDQTVDAILSLTSTNNFRSASRKRRRGWTYAARNFSALTPQTSRVPFPPYSACSRYFTGCRTEGVRLAYIPLNQPFRVHRFPLRTAHLLCLVSRCYTRSHAKHVLCVSKPSSVMETKGIEPSTSCLQGRHATAALRPHGKRSRRDSNPRNAVGVLRISNPLHSATMLLLHAPLVEGCDGFLWRFCSGRL